jgi:hypothetical protein
MASASPLSPTFYGHIASTQDALLLFEACLNGALNHVARRPHDRERANLIKSGNVFIYEEHSSGIKRWTDGVPWSPSRILGNFLVYRELERPFPPGEKKRAMKRSKRSPGINKAPEPYGGLNNGLSSGYHAASVAAPAFDSPSTTSLSRETERSLIGSLIDSYGFKDEGLVKKTVSVTVGGVSHHLVSYYTVADVMNNKFTTPTKDTRFQHITPRPDLITKQNFRTPIDEIDNLDRIDDRPVHNTYPFTRSGYEMTNQSISHRQMSLPAPPITYPQTSNLFNNYAMGANSGYVDAPNSGYGGQFAPAPGIYPAVKAENYDMGGYRQQRYNTVIGISSDRAQMPSVSSDFSRRSSNFEHGGSIDSGISGISDASNDSKLTTDSGYSSHGFYGALKDTANTHHNYAAQRSLPTPTLQTPYDRHPTTTFTHMDIPVTKENMWPIGNASTGHGHYISSHPVTHQQWASTGTS